MRFNRRIWVIFLLLLAAAILFWPQPAAAQSSPARKVAVYFFWGDGCPHCAAAKPFINDLPQRYPGVEVRMYEVWYVEANQDLWTKMAATYGVEPNGVPAIMVGDRYWEGYNDTIARQIESTVKTCLAQGCRDRGVGIIPGVMASPETEPAANNVPAAETPAADTLTLPLIGTVQLAGQSAWVSTALIAFVDGVNPCSIWVLSMLLAITLHTGSRKKVVIIGLVFLTVTAAIYALFIAGLFSVLAVVSVAGWIQAAVALVALFFALVNIKDYFWYQEGISFTISKSQKPGIYQKMRRLVDASQSFWGLVGATVALAAGVSLVEFSCTAGFPVLWTNLLVAQGIGGLTFVLLLLLYLLIYQLDEMVIFFGAVFTLKASRLEEKHGRLLKLAGGMLMLTLAAVMLIRPALLNSLDTSLLIFAVALLATLLVLWVHRVILPKMGIKIGSEAIKTRKRR